MAEKARVADADNVDDGGVANEDCRSEEEEAVEERREARAMRGRADDEGNNVGDMMVSFICVVGRYKYRNVEKNEKESL